MKVKILSMQRVENYGSFMQAYALKKVVESFGHSVTFCDFEPGATRHKGESVLPSDLAAKIAKLITAPQQLIGKRKHHWHTTQCFRKYAWPVLGIGAELDLDYSADLMIIGSDEVFNFAQNEEFGYVPVLFGHGVKAKALISYAASAGYATQQDVEENDLEAEISSGLSRFDALSVRDRNTYEIVERYAGTPPAMVIDPTLIYDFDTEAPSTRHTGDYLLLYAYEGRLDSPQDVEVICAFAAAKGLKIVSAGAYHHWCDENPVVKPFELLSLFRDARCVVTDTFHGTIFAIKNRKPFLSYLRKTHPLGSNSNKLAFLLQQLGLEERIVRDTAQFTAQLEREVDYAQVFQVLAGLRQKSMSFLTASLTTVEPAMQEKTPCAYSN